MNPEKKITRRDFLRRLLVSAAALGFGDLSLFKKESAKTIRIPAEGKGVTATPEVKTQSLPTATEINQEEILGQREIQQPIYWGNRNNPEVALTFDDGFSRSAIENTLKVLDENNVTATFFVIGRQLEAHADFWREAVAAGHQVCNHTYSHHYLQPLSPEQIKAELTQWEEMAKKVLGKEYVARMKKEFPYVRFPGGSGHKDEKVLRAVTEAGYRPIGWSEETYYAVLRHYDLKNDPALQIAQQVIHHVVSSARNGAIILLHFNVWDTLGLAEMVEGIQQKGLEIKTVSGVLD